MGGGVGEPVPPYRVALPVEAAERLPSGHSGMTGPPSSCPAASNRGRRRDPRRLRRGAEVVGLSGGEHRFLLRRVTGTVLDDHPGRRSPAARHQASGTTSGARSAGSSQAHADRIRLAARDGTRPASRGRRACPFRTTRTRGAVRRPDADTGKWCCGLAALGCAPASATRESPTSRPLHGGSVAAAGISSGQASRGPWPTARKRGRPRCRQPGRRPRAPPAAGAAGIPVAVMPPSPPRPLRGPLSTPATVTSNRSSAYRASSSGVGRSAMIRRSRMTAIRPASSWAFPSSWWSGRWSCPRRGPGAPPSPGRCGPPRRPGRSSAHRAG
jgi:hypothetical protein